MICSQTLKGDVAYMQHMSSVHGSSSTSGETGKEKLPEPKTAKTGIPIDTSIPPSPEFMELANKIDNHTNSLPSENLPAGGKPIPAGFDRVSWQEDKKLELRYQWIGNCPTCNVPVRTIIVRNDKHMICVAYCLTHNEVQQRLVPSLDLNLTHDSILEKTTQGVVTEVVKNVHIPIFEEEVNHNGKPRRKFDVHKKLTKSDEMQSS